MNKNLEAELRGQCIDFNDLKMKFEKTEKKLQENQIDMAKLQEKLNESLSREVN